MPDKIDEKTWTRRAVAYRSDLQAITNELGPADSRAIEASLGGA